MRCALVDVERGNLKFRMNDEEVTFHICKSMKQPADISVVSVIDTIDEAMDTTVEHELVGDMLVAVIMNYEGEDKEVFEETVNALIGLGSYHYNPNKLDLDLENRATPPVKPSIIEPSTLELKPLPLHLRYEFLGPNNTLPVIISARLMDEQREILLVILRRYKKAIGWCIADSQGIPPVICTHKIQLDEECELNVEHQRRLNPPMQEVVKIEIIEWLDVGVVYLLYRIALGLVRLMRIQKGWNHRGLREGIIIAFLMAILGTIESPLLPRMKRKSLSLVLMGPLLLKGCPLGYLMHPTLSKHCMMSIFSDMIEESIEIFMDDFCVAGDSFDECLENLTQVLKRCEETNLVLNWEKCHFMVSEGIVLGHKILEKGLEVDQAKIEVVVKLPPPISVKGVRSFLGHAGFYRRFIKDFSKIANPLCKLLEKESKFVFDDACLKAFEGLKERLTSAPTIIASDWSQPFELMCDANGYDMGAVLG
ncbi:uncharacterized protein LOC132057960 [Lycium ferocissimum]|uniref:uncharacterized protein LOC132057960 n=1 Tax=Lycium ferocissimum TaxID=112874 RepID=UPI00281694E1|nr:uncharacterized protein LOC132057960 [Lycium ferocissimum]